MAKSLSPTLLDLPLDYIRNNGNKMVVCSAQPTTFAEANATYALASVATVPSDFTKANGDTSGRKLTVAAKSAIAVATSGTGNHLAIIDTVNSALLAVTTAPSVALSAGGTVDTAAWKAEIQQAT